MIYHSINSSLCYRLWGGLVKNCVQQLKTNVCDAIASTEEEDSIIANIIGILKNEICTE